MLPLALTSPLLELKTKYLSLLKKRWPECKLQHWGLDNAKRSGVGLRIPWMIIPKRQHRLVCIKFGSFGPLRFFILKKDFHHQTSLSTLMPHYLGSCFTLCERVLLWWPANQSLRVFKNTKRIMICYNQRRNTVPEETSCILWVGQVLSIADVCHSVVCILLIRDRSQATFPFNCTKIPKLPQFQLSEILFLSITHSGRMYIVHNRIMMIGKTICAKSHNIFHLCIQRIFTRI